MNRFLGAAMRLLTALVAVASFAAHAAEPIKVGVLLSLSGGASFFGDPEMKALKLYAERFNNAGGVIGRPLQLVVYDDGSDANKARTFATRLTESDNVNVIIGGSTTGSTFAIMPVVEGAEIPFISLSGSVKIVEPVLKWVFKSPHTDRMGCERVFGDMKKRGITKIALLAGNDGFGVSMREQCLKVVSNYGIQVLIDQSYGAQDSDMTPQLSKIRDTAGVQAILNTGASGQGPAILTRNYGQLGMQKIILYQNPGVPSRAYIELSGSAANGVRLPAAAVIVADQLPDSDPQKPVLLEFVSSYEKTYSQPVSTFAGGAYDALRLTVEAIKRANSAEPKKIRDALEQSRGFVGTAGVVHMSAKDHLGLTSEAFRMIEVRNNDWKLLE